MKNDPKRELLRHLLATLKFRAEVGIMGANNEFAHFRLGEGMRRPGELIAHLGDLVEGSHLLMKGQFVELESPSLAWEAGARRFFAAVRAFDEYLASDAPLAQPIEKIMQGPIADALTHVGQIIMLRRAAGIPTPPTAYFTAEILPGA